MSCLWSRAKVTPIISRQQRDREWKADGAGGRKAGSKGWHWEGSVCGLDRYIERVGSSSRGAEFLLQQTKRVVEIEFAG